MFAGLKKRLWRLRAPAEVMGAVPSHGGADELTERLLAEWPAVSRSPGESPIFVFLQRRSNARFHAKLYLLVAHELAQRGIESYFLYEDSLLTRLPTLEVDGRPVSGSLREVEQRLRYETSSFPVPAHTWDIDAAEGTAVISGVDFSGEFLCTLRTLQRRYNVDFAADDTRRKWAALARTCDVVVSLFRALEAYATGQGRKVVYCGWESNYIPNAAFCRLCSEGGGETAQYIDLNRGYMHYFAGYTLEASDVACGNMTRTKVRSRLTILRSELDRAARDPEAGSFGRQAMDRALAAKFEAGDMGDRKCVQRLIDNHHSAGKPVYVLFAHLFYDVGLHENDGAFDDMADWILSTIEFFRGREDLLLLKPHPMEARSDYPHLRPTETLHVFAREVIDPANMHILHPLSYGVSDLAPHITGGLIWRSSVALELTHLGIPCAIAGSPPYDAVGLPVAADRGGYFRRVAELPMVDVPACLKEKVLHYVYCLWKKHHEVEQLRNDEWDRAALERYLRKGDPGLHGLVEDLLGESGWAGEGASTPTL